MSDPKTSYGDPVEESTDVDDVVGRANEGLADAEAAGAESGDAADADDHREQTDDESDGWASAYAAASGGEDYVPPTSTAETESADTTPGAAPASDTGGPDWHARADQEPGDERLGDDSPGDDSTGDDRPTEVVGAGALAATAGANAHGQPIFVQAPEAPMPRGNRAAAGAIGLLAALSFAVLYLLAWLTVGAIEGTVTTANVGTVALEALGTWALWIPVVVFFIAFWLLGAIINRGRWGYWVVFGLLVGAAAYGGHILGQLFQAPFWTLTASEGAQIVESQVLAPLAIAAFIFGRELTIWFGSWVAARGKRVSELNYEAQREYERTLEAGPQIVRPQQG